MKRIFTIVVLIASLVFTSCEDFLTEDVRGQLNVDTYYKSIEECESAVTSCYQAMTYGGWWQINTVWLLSEMCGDDAWMGNTSQSQSDYISLAHYQGNGASNGPISNFWQYRYKGILRCNIAIDRIAALETQETETRDRLVAEARFLRGYLLRTGEKFWRGALDDQFPNAGRSGGNRTCYGRSRVQIHRG